MIRAACSSYSELPGLAPRSICERDADEGDGGLATGVGGGVAAAAAAMVAGAHHHHLAHAHHHEHQQPGGGGPGEAGLLGLALADNEDDLDEGDDDDADEDEDDAAFDEDVARINGDGADGDGRGATHDESGGGDDDEDRTGMREQAVSNEDEEGNMQLVVDAAGIAGAPPREMDDDDATLDEDDEDAGALDDDGSSDDGDTAMAFPLAASNTYAPPTPAGAHMRQAGAAVTTAVDGACERRRLSQLAPSASRQLGDVGAAATRPPAEAMARPRLAARPLSGSLAVTGAALPVPPDTGEPVVPRGRAQSLTAIAASAFAAAMSLGQRGGDSDGQMPP